MKMKSVILLIVAVGCGLVAMLGVQQVLSGRSSGGDDKMVKVLIATGEIAPGTPLDETNTAVKEMDKEDVPEGAVTDRSQIDGKTIRSPAVPNEILMAAKLIDRYGASYEIPKGMRVVTTSVNLTKTHSGLIRPGDRVDILLSYKTRSPDRGMVSKTKTVLEYIEVFAADNILATEDQGDATEFAAKNLSFLVTPEQATLLKLAESKGELHLALRNKNDKEQVALAAADEGLLDDAAAAFGREDAYTGQDEMGPTFSESHEESADVRDAIAAELSESAGDEEPAVASTGSVDVEPAAPPTWPITIYSGGDVITQEVPLPLDENGMTEGQRNLAEREVELLEREAAIRAREAQLSAEQQNNKATDAPRKADDTQPGNGDTSGSSEDTDKWRTKSKELFKGVLQHFFTGA